MADINSSLIGFLKKKSLFATSPEKAKKQRDLSRDDKRPIDVQKSQKIISYNPEYRVQQAEHRNTNKNMQKHSSVQNMATMDLDVDSQNSMIVDGPIRYESYSPQNQRPSPPQRRNFHTEKQESPQPHHQQRQTLQQSQSQLPKNIWAGVLSKAITFESARMESAQCLQNLTVKLQTEISSINYKIDAFRSKMQQILDEEFMGLREKVIYMVQKIFQESQNNMKIYIREQEKALASEIVNMRDNLIKEYQKIELMKEEIGKPNWRKVAGELLSSDLEEKVQEMLLKSKSMSVKSWELRDLGQDKLPGLEREIRNVVKLHLT